MTAMLPRVLLAASLALGVSAGAQAAKDLVEVVDAAPDALLIEETSRRIAAIRASAEGKEGVSAFLEKRKPGWMQ